MKHTISVLVKNHAGVLSRISGLFSRRGFNIDSLAVGVTDDPTVSRITIIADGDEYIIEQIEKQLNKLIEVIKVRTLPNGNFLSRELVFIKVKASPEKRSEIMTVSEIMGVKIIDLSISTITLEISDTKSNIDKLEKILKPYGILEIVRTGVIAIHQGAEIISI